MSLKEQLSSFKEERFAEFSDEIKSTIIGDLQRLSASGIVERAPKVGDKCKDATLMNQRGEKTSLSSLLKKGPLVVTFYRGGWCPYCNLELRAYQEVLAEIQAAGATLVAITPELPDASLSTAEKNELEFEVLSDANSDYARELGIVFTVAEELRPLYESFGIQIEKHNGKGQFDVPLASTFIVDTDGTITYAFVAADYTLRAEPSEIVEKLKALKKGD